MFNVVFFKREFQKMQKKNLKMGEYLKEMKKLANNLTLAGHPITMDYLVSQILAGLDSMTTTLWCVKLVRKKA